MTSQRPAEQLVLFFAGMILVTSGCLHVLVWLADGGPLEGPVSWRKPILFGVSAGVTLLSLGWVVGKMRPRTGDLLLTGTLAAAMLVEVGLITLQQWRGVASHFNRASAVDGTVLAWIKSLIVLVTVAIAELTRRSFGPLSFPTGCPGCCRIRPGSPLMTPSLSIRKNTLRGAQGAQN
jgi:hypothetical protein